jgi:hypothetical protein
LGVGRAEEPYPDKKKAVGIHLSPEVVDYFKELAEETGVAYQKLIDLYLLDWARRGFGVTLDPSSQLPPAEWSNFTGIQGTPRVMQIALRYSF